MVCAGWKRMFFCLRPTRFPALVQQSAAPSSAFVSGTNGDPAPGKAAERLHTLLEKTDGNGETECRNMQAEKEEHEELAEPRWLSPSTEHSSHQPAPLTSANRHWRAGTAGKLPTPAAARGQEGKAAGGNARAPGPGQHRRSSRKRREKTTVPDF